VTTAKWKFNIFWNYFNQAVREQHDKWSFLDIFLHGTLASHCMWIKTQFLFSISWPFILIKHNRFRLQ